LIRIHFDVSILGFRLRISSSGWSRPGSVIQHYSDCGTSKETRNLLQARNSVDSSDCPSLHLMYHDLSDFRWLILAWSGLFEMSLKWTHPWAIVLLKYFIYLFYLFIYFFFFSCSDISCNFRPTLHASVNTLRYVKISYHFMHLTIARLLQIPPSNSLKLESLTKAISLLESQEMMEQSLPMVLQVELNYVILWLVVG